MGGVVWHAGVYPWFTVSSCVLVGVSVVTWLPQPLVDCRQCSCVIESSLLFVVHTMYTSLIGPVIVWATYWTVVASFPGLPWGRPGNEAKTVVLTVVLSFSTLEGR